MKDKHIIIALATALVIVFAAMVHLYHLVDNLNQQITSVNKETETLISENKKIYIYDLQEVLRKINAGDKRVQMEEQILKLNNELMAAEKKIKSLKNAKVKEDISDMYVKNLRLKRDEIMENFDKTVAEITDKINMALTEIAKEKNTSTIFIPSTIALRTPYVIDVTDEVVAKMQK